MMTFVPATGLALDTQKAAGLADKSIDLRQSKTRSLTGWFRRVERLDGSAKDFRRRPTPVSETETTT